MSLEKGRSSLCADFNASCTWEEEADQVFIGQSESKEISVSHMKSPGDEFQSLKRTCKLGNDGLYIMPGRYASDVIKNFEDFYGQAKKQKVPSGPENSRGRWI